MKLRIVIDANGDAWESRGDELARILRHAANVISFADPLPDIDYNTTILDINGDVVGNMSVIND